MMSFLRLRAAQVAGVAGCLLFPLVVASAAEQADVTLLDAKRGRSVECRIHFPGAGDALPLIVFSHGFGGDRTAFTAISQHWADHGYVVVHPSHQDGFGRSGAKKGAAKADEESAPTVGGRRAGALRGNLAGGGLAGLMSDPAKVEGRVRDVTFILDALGQIYEKVPALKGRIDVSRVGVGGHSYGAYTSMLIGGVTVDLGGQKARSFGDPRVRCILPVSAQGTGQQGLTEGSWKNLKLPMMTITGSRDQGAGGQGSEWKKEPFTFSPPGDKYLLFIEGANHVSFGGFGGRESDITRVVKAATLAYWDAYLRGDAGAKASLQNGGVMKPFAGKASLQSK
jgi:predicted dienelactone hydrolase